MRWPLATVVSTVAHEDSVTAERLVHPEKTESAAETYVSSSGWRSRRLTGLTFGVARLPCI